MNMTDPKRVSLPASSFWRREEYEYRSINGHRCAATVRDVYRKGKKFTADGFLFCECLVDSAWAPGPFGRSEWIRYPEGKSPVVSMINTLCDGSVGRET